MIYLLCSVRAIISRWVSIVGSLRDREVACSASDRQGSNFESCVWRTVSSQSSHHPQEVLLAQFSLYVHKGGLKPDSFHFIYFPLCCSLKHTTTLFSLSDHYILSRELRIFVDKVLTNYYGRPMVLNLSSVTQLLIMRDLHYARMCFKSVKTLELYIPTCENNLGLRPRPFSQLRM